MNLSWLIRLTHLPKRQMFALALVTVTLLLGVPAEASDGQSLLHANGRNIVNTDGEIVSLRGVNLGGWFINGIFRFKHID